jgi:hypothetical protein
MFDVQVALLHGLFPIMALAAKAVIIPNGRFTSSR